MTGAQRRLRSVWASAQTDQSLHCPHEETLGPSYLLSAQRRVWSDWVEAQADLSLHWAHRSFGWFCHPLAHIFSLFSGTAPLWIFVLGQYFQKTEGSKIIPIYNFEIWLASTFFAYTAGLVINKFKPVVADALLNWLIKPVLLLATILYITLGVYINMYVFEVIEKMTVLAAILLPLCGVLVGAVLSIIFRQKSNFCKTIALETSSLNCLLVLAALRFSLGQPAAELASILPIWVMFTIPGLYVVLAILRVIKRSVDEFLESRKEKQYRHYSIASGIVNQANMAALSAPLFVTDTCTEEDQASASEKITVL